jgi:hypothetical protein
MPHFECGAFNLRAISSRGQLASLERVRDEFWLAVLIAAVRRQAEGRLATACTAANGARIWRSISGKSGPYF